MDALSELYDRYCERAYRVAVSVCCDDRRAQEAVQEAFLTVWKGRGEEPHPRGTVAAWLLVLVRDCANRRDREDDARHPEPTIDPRRATGSTTRREEAQWLGRMLGELPDAHQEVIILAYHGGLSHSEIAAQLGLADDTVKRRMRLGLHQLQASRERRRARL